jgi:hypothetical protein
MILRRIAVLAALLGMAEAACDYIFNSAVPTLSFPLSTPFLTVTQAPTVKLTDLRSAVPMTFIESVALASCAAVKTTATVYATIYVSGTAYPADKSEEYVMGVATTGLVTWEFPQLILTNLVPGEIATLVLTLCTFATIPLFFVLWLGLMGV